MKREITVSSLPKTWILDLDGTIFKHNGYKIDGKDSLIPGVTEHLLNNINQDDLVIIITSRTKEYAQITEECLKKNNIRYDYIIYGAPFGERIVVNDIKPSGLKMAVALNVTRDSAEAIKYYIDENL